MANTIMLKCYSDNIEQADAGEAGIYPGHLLSRNTSGEFILHAGASTKGEVMFAIEDDLEGEGITDVYTSGTPVRAIHAYSGDEINALIKSGENIAIGDVLEPYSDGTLVEGSTAPVAIAIEAISSAVSGTHYAVKIL